MATTYYKLIRSKDPANWTTEIVLERDENGQPTRVIQAGVPVQLSADERQRIEDLGFIVEDSSKDEADQVSAQQPQAGSDIAGAAPVFTATTAEPTQ